MNTKKVVIVIAMLVSVLLTSAQVTERSINERKSGWSTVFIEWTPSSFIINGLVAPYNGYSLGFSHTFVPSSTSQVRLETGAAVQYSYFSEHEGEEETDVNTKINVVSAKIPINLIYRIDFPNKNIELLPYLGITARGNFWGEMKLRQGGKVFGRYFDLFDKTEMGGKEYIWKHFQVGWQVGMKMRFSHSLILGAGYGFDFNNCAKNTKNRTGSISIGYSF